MLAERVERWRREWYQGEFEKGMETGVREATDRLRGLVVELAEIKFGEGTAFEVSGLVRQIASPRRIAEVADAVMGCNTPGDLIARGEALIDTPSLSFSMMRRRLREMEEDTRREGFSMGFRKGLEQGLGRERSLARRLACQKFGPERAVELSLLIDQISDPEEMVQVVGLMKGYTRGERAVAAVRGLVNRKLRLGVLEKLFPFLMQFSDPDRITDVAELVLRRDRGSRR